MNTRTKVLSALWFLLVVNYLDRVAMSFAGPSIMKSLHISPAAFGIVLSSFGVGYMLAQVPGGLLADRWGAKLLLVVGPLFWALFTGATGLVATVAGFVIVRACFGLSEGLANTSVYKTIGEVFEAKERSRALAIMSTAIPLAPAFAGALIGKLIVAYGWQGMFFFIAAPALLAALISLLLLPSSPTVRHEAHARGSAEHISFRSVLSRPSLWLLSLAAFAWNIPYWGYLGWMPSYLALAHHIDLKSIGALAAIPYVFSFFGLILGGWLGSTALHRYCPQLVVFAWLGTGLSLFLAYQAGSLSLCLAGLCSTSFFLFITHGPIGKIALDLAPEQYRAAYVGVYNTTGQLGGVAAPAVIGFLVSATGTFASGFGFMIGGLLVASVLMLALVPFMPPAEKPRLAAA